MLRVEEKRMSETTLTHVDGKGEVKMVDVSAKPSTPRSAVASGTVRCAPETIRAVREQATKKGDVLSVIRIAGIQGVKQAPAIIPLAHPVVVQAVDVDVDLGEDSIRITASVKTVEKTGIEMEALTAVAAAALTAIDMVKGIDRSAYIERIWVEEKVGGRSGTWRRGPDGKMVNDPK